MPGFTSQHKILLSFFQKRAIELQAADIAYLWSKMGILVDDDGYSRLSGFSSLTIVSGAHLINNKYVVHIAGASQPRIVVRPTHEGIEFLFPRYGDIRGPEWGNAIYRNLSHVSGCFRNHHGFVPHQTSRNARIMVRRRAMGDVGIVLEK